MKKIFSVLLATVILLSAISCGNSEEASSEPQSELTSEISVEESSMIMEESIEESSEEYSESEEILKIRSYMTNDVDRSMLAKNIFATAKYTYSVDPTSDYADSNMKKLTDGIKMDVFDKYDWVGFANHSTVEVTFDLKNNENSLADVEIGVLQQQSYGINYPSKVTLSVSEDNETFTDLSALLTPSNLPSSSKYVYRFALEKATTARYIKITFLSSSGFIFVDEICGYEYCADGTIDVTTGEGDDGSKTYDYYEYTLEKDVSVKVSESDSDYSTYQNLALLDGVKIGAQHFDPLPKEYYSVNSTAEELYKLIDGKISSSLSFGGNVYAKFVRAAGRHIIIDLGNEMSVNKVCGQFLHSKSAGIACPAQISVSVSTDGENWVTTACDFTGMYDKTEAANYLLNCEFAASYVARYVRFSFVTQYSWETSCMVYCSELEVWGTKSVNGAVEAKTDLSIIGGRYPTTEEAGVENMIFSLAATDGNITTKNSLCVFAYLDSEGKITDWLSDGVTFRCKYESYNLTDTKAMVEANINDMYKANYNMFAFEEIAGKIRAEYDDNYRLKVWFQLITPKKSYTCADIDGDGKDENFSNTGDCLDFLKWQIDELIEKFESCNFQNLTLCGFYWLNECLDKNNYSAEKKYISECNEYIHSKGYTSHWCPYYGAYGQWAWKEIGFDWATLQPNYMFYATETTRLSATAEIAKILGMAVEIEIEDAMGEGSVGIYREYLREGYDSGYMNSVKLYYIGNTPGAIGRMNSSNRTLYDETYLYAKCRLDESYDKSSSVDLSGFGDITVNTTFGKGITFTIENLDKVNVRIIKSQNFGNLRISQSGMSYYTPRKDFKGVDTAIIELSDDVGNAKTITITFNIN